MSLPRLSKRGLRLLGGFKLYVGLLLVVALAVLISPKNSAGERIFLNQTNLANVLRQVSNNGILAVGMTLVILTAGIDLSVGSLMGVGCTLTAMLLTLRGWTPASILTVPSASILFGGAVFLLVVKLWPKHRTRWATAIGLPLGGILAGLVALWLRSETQLGFHLLSVMIAATAFCALLGLLSGLIIAYGKLQPFVVTLAMMMAALGAGRLISGRGGQIHPIYKDSENVTEQFWVLQEMVSGLHIPVPGIVFLGCVVIAFLLLRTTPFGRHVYAVGGNEEAARLSGIPVERIKVMVYGISGALAGLTGVLYAAQYRQGKPDAGTGAELDAIAAVVVGGTSLMGGRGSILGTFAGVLMLGVLNNLLSLKNVDSNLQLILKASIIIGAILVQQGRHPWTRLFNKKMRSEEREAEL